MLDVYNFILSHLIFLKTMAAGRGERQVGCVQTEKAQLQRPRARKGSDFDSALVAKNVPTCLLASELHVYQINQLLAFAIKLLQDYLQPQAQLFRAVPHLDLL